MKETTNFGLKKPEANDFYDFETQNDNLDVIDEKLKECMECGTAEKVTYENESVADVTNVKEALDGIFDGTQQVGDTARLGDELPTYYAARNELERLGTHSDLNLNQEGWYRIAHTKVGVEYLAYASYTQSLEIKIARAYNDNNNELHLIRMGATYGKFAFASIFDQSNEQLFTKIRYTFTSELDCYIEVYYSSNSINHTSIEVSDGGAFYGAWKAITPILTEETVDGVTVVSIYDIPANSSLVTDWEFIGYVSGQSSVNIDASKYKEFMVVQTLGNRTFKHFISSSEMAETYKQAVTGAYFSSITSFGAYVEYKNTDIKNTALFDNGSDATTNSTMYVYGRR